MSDFERLPGHHRQAIVKHLLYIINQSRGLSGDIRLLQLLLVIHQAEQEGRLMDAGDLERATGIPRSTVQRLIDRQLSHLVQHRRENRRVVFYGVDESTIFDATLRAYKADIILTAKKLEH